MTIIKKFEPEKQQKRIPKVYIGLITLFLLALILVEIWVNNTTVSFGEKFKKIEDLEHALSIDNQILENEIAKNSSLISISSKSAELGFSPPQSIQYIR